MPLHIYTPYKRVNPALIVVLFMFAIGSALTASAQQSPPLKIFKNYFVTGDYVVAGWVENSSTNGLATGIITVPDCRQAQYMGITCPPSPVQVGADIVSAYLYWGTAEGSQSLFAGQQAFFNGYKIVGDVLGILMLLRPGARAVVQDPPLDQRQCGSIAPTFGLTCRST